MANSKYPVSDESITPGTTVYTQFSDGIDFLISTDVDINKMLKVMEKDSLEGNKGDSIEESVTSAFGFDTMPDPDEIPNISQELNAEELPLRSPATLDIAAEEMIEAYQELSSGRIHTEWSMMDIILGR